MKKLLRTSLVFVAAVGILLSLFAMPAFAASTTCNDPAVHCEDPAISAKNCTDAAHCDLITTYINPFVNFLAAFIGVAVVIAIIYGGIEYGSSGGDPQKAAAGKNRIKNAILALLTFFFFYAILNFLIPGGLL